MFRDEHLGDKTNEIRQERHYYINEVMQKGKEV